MKSVYLLLAILFLLPLGHSSAEERTLKIVASEFPPYISAHLPGNGWAWNVAETILKNQGYSVSLQLVPWNRAVQLTKTGAVDALYLANVNSERKQWAVFSDPIGAEISVIFKRKEKEFIFTKISDLASHKVGAMRGAHVADLLEKSGISVLTCSTNSECLKMLYRGRLELLVADRYVTSNAINTQFPQEYSENIDFLDTPVDSNQLHLAISNKVFDHLQIQQRFNQGLKNIIENGIYGQILKKHGF